MCCSRIRHLVLALPNDRIGLRDVGVDPPAVENVDLYRGRERERIVCNFAGLTPFSAEIAVERERGVALGQRGLAGDFDGL